MGRRDDDEEIPQGGENPQEIARRRNLMKLMYDVREVCYENHARHTRVAAQMPDLDEIPDAPEGLFDSIMEKLTGGADPALILDRAKAGLANTPRLQRHGGHQPATAPAATSSAVDRLSHALDMILLGEPPPVEEVRKPSPKRRFRSRSRQIMHGQAMGRRSTGNGPPGAAASSSALLDRTSNSNLTAASSDDRAGSPGEAGTGSGQSSLRRARPGAAASANPLVRLAGAEQAMHLAGSEGAEGGERLPPLHSKLTGTLRLSVRSIQSACSPARTPTPTLRNR